MNDKMLNEFLRYYSAGISTDRYSESVSFFDTKYRAAAADFVQYADRRYREKMVSLEMPMNAFENLVTQDHNLALRYSQDHEEAKLRKMYPAVADAYSQYKLLLSLCS